MTESIVEHYISLCLFLSYFFFRDNHDLSAYISWDPERIYGSPESWEETKSLFKQNVNFLQLRVAALISISVSINIVKSSDGIRQKHLDKLKSVLNDWKNLYDSVIKENIEPIQEVIFIITSKKVITFIYL